MQTIAQIISTLNLAARTFAEYAEMHAAKGPGHEAKVERNLRLATQCKEAYTSSLRLFITPGNTPSPCGYTEPESDYRDIDTGAHRTAKCEGGRLVVRGNLLDSVTDGTQFISSRPCPKCNAAIIPEAVKCESCDGTGLARPGLRCAVCEGQGLL